MRVSDKYLNSNSDVKLTRQNFLLNSIRNKVNLMLFPYSVCPHALFIIILKFYQRNTAWSLAITSN